MAKTSPRTKNIHVCTQEDAIVRINTLLVGNGNPKSGLAFKVERLSDQFEETHADVKEIKQSLKDLTKMYDDTFDAASSVASAFEQYKAEKESYRQGKESVINEVVKKKDDNKKITTIVLSILVLLVTIINVYGAYFSRENNILNKDAVKTKVNDEVYSEQHLKILELKIDSLLNK